MPLSVTHTDLANAIRFLSIDAVEAAKSGHPGMPMGAADMATVLFRDFLQFNPQDPDWANRDRFVLSAGHGSMLLYSLLHLTGYADFDLDQIKSFRQWGSRTAGHPEYGHGKGIETTTGPLGQGLATAVGLALGERMANARFGDDAINHYTYVVAGDGDLMEGVSHEAIQLAGHLNLSKLIVLFDDNEITIDGDTGKSFTGCHLKRFEAANWNAWRIDGHDPQAIHDAIAKAKTSDKPCLIACRTIIGKGAPNKQNSAGIHGAPLGAAEIDLVRKAFDWPHAPFEIPQNIHNAWLEIGKKGIDTQKNWQQSVDVPALTQFLSADIPQSVHNAINAYKQELADNPIHPATRVASQNVLEIINPLCHHMIGGSADLTGSNNTKTKKSTAVTKTSFDADYIHYGVREFGMAAAMNGLAIYGGFVPYGGTFLVFSDYSRPAIRLAALMGIRVIHVLTHDSIGLGEDGPTHQPVEHIASLRSIPNLAVFRPCDSVETAECWIAAIDNKSMPSALALTRQGLKAQRTTHTSENLCLKGAYILHEANASHQVTLYASGSEVEIAAAARETLEAQNIGTRIVSVPCFELFFKQSEAYQASILKGDIRIAIEAGCIMGWEHFISDKNAFVGMHSFGASAPAKTLYKEFGITADAIIEKVLKRIT
ncbi:MAG: transketolase [Alphaproteobacteria bacterium]|jgi:transketolase